MKKLLKKDKNNRNLVFNHEINRFVLKNISKNYFFSLKKRLKFILLLSMVLKKSSLSHVVNRCVFTGRKKRISQLYSFSRLVFLKLVRFGFLSGFKKASW